MKSSGMHIQGSIGSFSPGAWSDGILGDGGTYFGDVRALSVASYPSFAKISSGGGGARTGSGGLSLIRHVPSCTEAFPFIFRCSPSKTDPTLIVCDEKIMIDASPGPAVAALAAKFASAGSVQAPPVTYAGGQVKTALDVIIVTDALEIETLKLHAVLREDISKLGLPEEAMRIRDILGGNTQVTLARCTDGRPIFCSRAKMTIQALMQAGMLWTVEVAPHTQAALVFPISLEAKILMRRGMKAYIFGTYASIAVQDVGFEGLVADACSPALGVPVTAEPDRAVLAEYLMGRDWTEQTRHKALNDIGHRAQDHAAWRRFCAFLETMGDARKDAEYAMLSDALMRGFDAVEEHVAKFVAARIG